MLQLRSAWAIAQALNRTLVLPELWSGQDRYWAPHNGRLPGSGLELPFLAPADHIIDLESYAIPRARQQVQISPAVCVRCSRGPQAATSTISTASAQPLAATTRSVQQLRCRSGHCVLESTHQSSWSSAPRFACGMTQ